jgi:hypothetical protein
MQYDANQPPPEAGSANANRPFKTLAVTGTPYVIPSLADILRIGKVGYSYYNALQTKLEKRYSSGVSLLASYSYSKTISLGGWSIDPIFTFSTGLPFNLTVTGNPSNTGTGLGGSNDRPNIVGDYRAALNSSTNTATRTKAQWFNTAAFAANPIYTFGNAGRNILRADGTANLDLSAHKKIKITEGVNAQLRLEAFNIANHDVLAAPNAAVGSTTFGQVTSAGNTARELQAAVKIVF